MKKALIALTVAAFTASVAAPAFAGSGTAAKCGKGMIKDAKTGKCVKKRGS
ncbi:MAG: hypothetical protein AAFR04_10880 [Pseudomonadota bacterium]